MEVNNGFRKFVIKKMIDTAKFNPDTGYFEIKQRSLGRRAMYDIEREGQLYDYSMIEIGKLIEELSRSDWEFSAKSSLMRDIDPVKLKMEQHLKIYYKSDDLENYDEFLKIGKSEFLLIDHDRGALKPGIILKAASSPWHLNAKVKFNIVYGENNGQIYETGTLNKIELQDMSFVYELLQMKEEELRRIVYAKPPDLNAGFKATDFSAEPEEGYYYSIWQKGGKADFAFVKSDKYDLVTVLKDLNTIISSGCHYDEKPSAKITAIRTIENGLLYFEDGYWKIINKAKINFE